ncbi:MBL fold metallo-hydrolase [Evansella sp. AB-P1]|uniref:MBL fold metallo-hydrolase n=1 Tax=Evansella sp. AB-P1 TaxID=3037653 RepID=UPI00241F35DC|nr:MBL fold metallo-hydrolase [Evansella sp. AB-P1]MDG5786797.1 MBL fold metallo-hydrolase [Evansella sp. AB-P1]
MIVFKNKHVTVFQSSIVQTNSTVIETEDMILVVDPAWLPSEVEMLRVEVEKLIREADRPVYLLFTHSDFDHVLGYGAFPKAKTIASIGVKEHSAKEEIVKKIKAFDDEIYVKRQYEIEFPQINHVIVEDGQKLTLGATVLTFYRAPGHTADGIFTVIDSLGIFIGGDYLSDQEFPFIENRKDYERTLVKAAGIVENHPITLYIPGHGQPTDDTREIIRRQQNDLQYIRKLTELFSVGNKKNELEEHINQYEFIEGIRQEHDKNMEVVKKEIVQDTSQNLWNEDLEDRK